MVHTRIRAAGIPLVVLASGCGRAVESASPPIAVEVPEGWPRVVPPANADWTSEELDVLNAALYLVESSLAVEDPRRPLLRGATYAPFDRWAEIDGPRPQGAAAVFSMRTGNVYVERPSPSDVLVLATTLAHELHHLERDRTPSVNRMQEVDRERRAHAREAEDVGRMLAALRERSADSLSIQSLELARAQARALSAMYAAKLELFRLVQAMDAVDDLREMPDLYRLYEECITIAESRLGTDHGAELHVLDALSGAADGTPAEGLLAMPIERARGAVVACWPLQASVDELRSHSGSRWLGIEERTSEPSNAEEK